MVASATLPGILRSEALVAKNASGKLYRYEPLGECWADGSLHSDIPRKEISAMFNVKYFIVSQMNPHIIPFIHRTLGTAGEPSPVDLGGRIKNSFIFSFLELCLKMDMKKWLKLMRYMDLTPSLGNVDFRKVYLQEFFGTVTISPKIDYVLMWGFWMLFSDPSEKDMELYFRYGKNLTFPKLQMIHHRQHLESLLY